MKTDNKIEKVANVQENGVIDNIWSKYQEALFVEVSPRLNTPFRIYEPSLSNVWIDENSHNSYGFRHLELEVGDGVSSNFVGNIYVGTYIDGSTFVIGTRTMNPPYLLHEHDKLIEMLNCAKKVWVTATSEDTYFAPNWNLAEPDWKTINPLGILTDNFENDSEDRLWKESEKDDEIVIVNS